MTMLLRIRCVCVAVNRLYEISYLSSYTETSILRRGQDYVLPNTPDTKKDLGVDYSIALVRPVYEGIAGHRRTDPEKRVSLSIRGRTLFECSLWITLRRLKDEDIRITGTGHILVDKMYRLDTVPAKVPLDAAQQALLHLDRKFPKTLPTQ